jgi:hypothetical protein
MHYKTIILELLEQKPQIHDQLRRQRLLLPALDLYAENLKTSHEAWQAQLSQAKPQSAPLQIASEALELALKDLEGHLPSESLPETDEPLSLEEAMEYLRRHTPSG